MFDVFCFGLSLIEMISSDISGSHAFKQLCKMINRGEKNLILGNVLDDKLRDFISRCLEEDPLKRASIEELLEHPFLINTENVHEPIKLAN